jgi:hypothetical protein
MNEADKQRVQNFEPIKKFFVKVITVLVIVVVIVIVAIRFLAPTFGDNCFYGCNHGGPVSFNKGTFLGAATEIRSLIAGENPDTSKLENFLAYEVEPGSHPCSELTIETCCTWWLNGCQGKVHRLLKMAYSNALTNHHIVAKFYLSRADTVSSKRDCFECSCESWYCNDYVIDISYYTDPVFEITCKSTAKQE